MKIKTKKAAYIEFVTADVLFVENIEKKTIKSVLVNINLKVKNDTDGLNTNKINSKT